MAALRPNFNKNSAKLHNSTSVRSPQPCQSLLHCIGITFIQRKVVELHKSVAKERNSKVKKRGGRKKWGK